MRANACDVFRPELERSRNDSATVQLLQARIRCAAIQRGSAPYTFAFVVAGGLGKRQHVLFNHAAAADDGMFADPAKLVNRAKPANIRIVLHCDVAREGDAIRQNRMVMNHDVVRHMDIGHNQVVIADYGAHAAAFGAAMNGDEFANTVAVADNCLRCFAAIFLVLRRHPARAERKEYVIFADVSLSSSTTCDIRRVRSTDGNARHQ